MYVLIVNIQVKPEHIEDFIQVVLANAQGSRSEPGNLRFDVLRSTEDPNHFQLYEVYGDAEALAAHRTTPHYQAFAAAVEPWLTQPRTRIASQPLFYGNDIVLGK